MNFAHWLNRYQIGVILILNSANVKFPNLHIKAGKGGISNVSSG